jgi:hypothetical protein
VVAAAAAAAVAAEWIDAMNSSGVLERAREAARTADELAERLSVVQQKKKQAAAEADMLRESLKSSSYTRGVVVGGGGPSTSAWPQLATPGKVCRGTRIVRGLAEGRRVSGGGAGSVCTLVVCINSVCIFLWWHRCFSVVVRMVWSVAWRGVWDDIPAPAPEPSCRTPRTGGAQHAARAGPCSMCLGGASLPHPRCSTLTASLCCPALLHNSSHHHRPTRHPSQAVPALLPR